MKLKTCHLIYEYDKNSLTGLPTFNVADMVTLIESIKVVTYMFFKLDLSIVLCR